MKIRTTFPDGTPCVWDIETGPMDEHELLTLQAKAGKNFATDKLALNPLTGKILSIGLWVAGHRSPVFFENANPHGPKAEGEVIAAFLGYLGTLREPIMVGHNTMGFDLPFIFRRGWGLKIQEVWNLGDLYHFDLMRTWMEADRSGQSERISLATLAAHLDINYYKAGRGEEFAKLFSENIEAARRYLRRDLELTIKCAEALLPGFGGFALNDPDLVINEYQPTTYP